MHAEQKGGAPDFWPGYVDALINVILNLLFVVAIFCLALFVMGAEHGRRQALAAKQAARLAEQVAEGAPAAPGPSAEGSLRTPSQDGSDGAPPSTALQEEQQGRALILPVRATTIAAVATAPVRVERLSDAGGTTRTRLVYPRGVVTLDEQAMATLEQAVRGEMTGRTIVLWSSTDLSQQGARRAAMLRLVHLRELMTAAGHDPAQIVLRMSGGGQWPEANGATVWLALTDPGAPATALISQEDTADRAQ